MNTKHKIIMAVLIAIVLWLIVAMFAYSTAQAAFGLPSLFDLNWSFDYAVISLPNGWTVEGVVQSWKDYENSDVIQIKIGGVTYLTHYSNVVMIDE